MIISPRSRFTFCAAIACAAVVAGASSGHANARSMRGGIHGRLTSGQTTGTVNPGGPMQPAGGIQRGARMALHKQSSLLSMIHQVNIMEIKAGGLAGRLGGTAGVRSYGKMLVRDHTKCDHMLLKIARQENVPILKPRQLSARKRHTLKKQMRQMAALKRLHGASFDKKFLSAMARDHKKAIAMLEKARPAMRYSHLSAFLNKTILVLKKHYRMAVKLEHKEHGVAMR